MLDLRELDARTEIPLLVAFCDVHGFDRQARRRDDREIADTIDGYYILVAERVAAAEGIVVKFIGDGALAVFTELSVDRGVHALLHLKPAVDDYFRERGWPVGLFVKIHFGPVIAGPYGSERRFDVIGKTVNAAARLETPGIALSTQAFRKLGPDLRKRFKKHTPPITYIRGEDPHT